MEQEMSACPLKINVNTAKYNTIYRYYIWYRTQSEWRHCVYITCTLFPAARSKFI